MSFKGVCKELSAKIIVPFLSNFDAFKKAIFMLILAAANSHGSKHVKFCKFWLLFGYSQIDNIKGIPINF